MPNNNLMDIATVKSLFFGNKFLSVIQKKLKFIDKVVQDSTSPTKIYINLLIGKI